MNEEFNDRFKYSGNNIPNFISNDKIQCIDCLHKEKSILECKKYYRKPDYVLEKRKSCPYYALSKSQV